MLIETAITVSVLSNWIKIVSGIMSCVGLFYGVFKVINWLKSTLIRLDTNVVELKKNGIVKAKRVHRLVALTYIKKIKGKNIINHINNIKDDNRVENLEWVTQRENIIHARDVLGVKYSLSGFQNPNARFLESHELILSNLYRKGFGLGEIAEIMGFSEPTIDSHLKRK